MKKEPVEGTIDITDMNSDGAGVGRSADGKVCFVNGAVIGDTVEADIIKKTSGYNVCRLARIVKPSELRVDGCVHAGRCGGCVFSNITYEAELEIKRRLVDKALMPFGISVGAVGYGSGNAYRNKVAYPIGVRPDGTMGFGYYAPHSHDIVFHSSCMLQDDAFAHCARVFLDSAQSLGLTPYDEKSGKGLLRHLLMRRNSDGCVSLCVVINADSLSHANELAEALKKNAPECTAFLYNVNRENTNVITGSKCVYVFGEPLRETLCLKEFSLSPLSFFQVNRDMAQRLYLRAKEYASLGEDGILLDLYCGIGSVGLCIAGDANPLCGVECVESAVEDAKKNAAANGRKPELTRFLLGDAVIGVGECRRFFGRNPDVIVVDPPRKGLDGAVITEVTGAAPKRIVYISCNPSTLSRDLALFAANGYVCRGASAFDLFPRTFHVETVVWMEKNK